jgi:hypothetical protein
VVIQRGTFGFEIGSSIWWFMRYGTSPNVPLILPRTVRGVKWLWGRRGEGKGGEGGFVAECAGKGMALALIEQTGN